MRVAIISELKKGGVEKVNYTLATKLSSCGIHVKMISILGEEEKDKLPFDYACLKQKKKMKSWGVLRKELCKFSPTIILTSSFLDAMLVLAYKRKRKVNVVYVQHSVYSMAKGSSVKQKIINELFPKLINLFNRIQGIIFVSYGVEKDFNKFFKKYTARTMVIYNPITDASFYEYRKIQTSPIRLVTAGRIEYEKNQEILIKTVKKLNDNNIDATLSIYGEGSLKFKLQLLSKDLGIEDKIIFQGFKENLQSELSNYDIFVLSSLHESFGNVLVEAMNACVPVISTDCPVGPREILNNGEVGYLVRTNNPCDIMGAIIELVNENNIDLIKRAYERSKEFSIESSVTKYIRFFEMLEKEDL